MSKSTIRTYKKTVWTSFANYIKARDSQNGYCECCTCSKIMWWNDPECNAGHFLAGRGNSVLFDETIVHAQCSRCNNYGGGMPWDYEKFMMKRYGYDYQILEEIKSRRHIVKKFTMEDLKAEKKHWEMEFNRIKKEKGI